MDIEFRRLEAILETKRGLDWTNGAETRGLVKNRSCGAFRSLHEAGYTIDLDLVSLMDTLRANVRTSFDLVVDLSSLRRRLKTPESIFIFIFSSPASARHPPASRP